jgi:hypothetical protein
MNCVFLYAFNLNFIFLKDNFDDLKCENIINFHINMVWVKIKQKDAFLKFI